MKITTEFSIIPDAYAKKAPHDALIEGEPCVSFPFVIEHLNPAVKYLHWEFSDPDSIPVCGFEWIHWTMANLPVDAIMFDPLNPQALAIPEDFSRIVPSMIPQALQGRNSSASPLLGRSNNPDLYARYNGPVPPDKDHQYILQVWGSAQPLDGLEQGFWLNEMMHAFDRNTTLCDQGGVALIGRA